MFKFVTNIPFRNRLNNLVGQKNPTRLTFVSGGGGGFPKNLDLGPQGVLLEEIPLYPLEYHRQYVYVNVEPTHELLAHSVP